MKGKAKGYKLKFKPTPISRLRKAPKTPFTMVGDPPWSGGWTNRERAVYEHEMERKSWPMAWKPEAYNLAWDHNRYIDMLVRRKWDNYLLAHKDHREWLWNEVYNSAERDN